MTKQRSYSTKYIVTLPLHIVPPNSSVGKGMRLLRRKRIVCLWIVSRNNATKLRALFQSVWFNLYTHIFFLCLAADTFLSHAFLFVSGFTYMVPRQLCMSNTRCLHIAYIVFQHCVTCCENRKSFIVGGTSQGGTWHVHNTCLGKL